MADSNREREDVCKQDEDSLGSNVALTSLALILLGVLVLLVKR